MNGLDKQQIYAINLKALFDNGVPVVLNVSSGIRKVTRLFEISQPSPRLRTAAFLLQLYLSIGFVAQMKTLIAHDSIQKTLS